MSAGALMPLPVPYPTSLSWTSDSVKAQGSGYLKPTPPLIAGFTQRPRVGKIPSLGLHGPSLLQNPFLQLHRFCPGPLVAVAMLTRFSLDQEEHRKVMKEAEERCS